MCMSPVPEFHTHTALAAGLSELFLRLEQELGLTTPAEIERRANDALVGYIGNTSMLLGNLREVVALV